MENKTDNRNHEAIQRTSFFRFYEELNDFLPKKLRNKLFVYTFTGTPSVKNTIEAIGIPQAEVDLVLVDGNSVDFDFIIKGGEHISVYPVFETLDISPLVRLRPKPLRKIQFVVDVNLGKLAQKLRLLGFDTLYRNDYADDELVIISLVEKRIILTRDKGVLKHSDVKHGFWLRSDDPKQQLIEVVDRLQLHYYFQPFSRCSACNGNLSKVDKSEIKTKIPEDTFTAFEEFWECSGCGNIYWRGSHYEKICTWVKKLKSQENE